MKRIVHMHSIYKLCIALGVAIIALLCTLPYSMEVTVRMMIGWDVFSIVYLFISWMILFNAKPESIKVIAGRQDTRSYLVFLILCVAIISSVVTILLLITHRQHWAMNKLLVTAIYIFGVTASWGLHHTIFAFHYAHMYYGDARKNPAAGGLGFPGDEKPDYMDFAYFSFVIGMTFQVSDVTITSPKIRRFALMHSVLSFGFNTVIVALSVNALVNM